MSFNQAGSLSGQSYSLTNKTNSTNEPQKTDSKSMERKLLRQFLANFSGVPTEAELRNTLERKGATNIQITINKSKVNDTEIMDVHITFTWGGEEFDQSRRFEFTKTGPELQLISPESNQENSEEPIKINSQDFYKKIDTQATTISEKMNLYKYLNQV